MNNVQHSQKVQKATVESEFNLAQFQAIVRLGKELHSKFKLNSLQIHESKVAQWVNGSGVFVSADLTDLMDGAKTTITLPLEGRAFGQFEALYNGGEKVKLISNDKGRMLTNGNLRVELPDIAPVCAAVPATKNDILGVAIDNINIRGLMAYLGRRHEVMLLVYKSQLEQVWLPGNHPYTFVAQSAEQLEGVSPDIELHSSHFLRWIGKHEHKLELASNNTGYWLKTSFTVSKQISVVVYEQLFELRVDSESDKAPLAEETADMPAM